MAAEIQRQDIISDDALAAPLQLAKNIDVAVASLDKLVQMSTSNKSNVSAADSTAKLTKETNNLSLAQQELIKIQKQIAVAQVKDNENYKTAVATLKAVKDATKEKTLIDKEAAKAVTASTASIKTLEAALKRNKDAYKELTTEEQRNSKAGQELLKVIQSQDTDVKKLSKSLGENQKEVGNYEKALSSVKGVLVATFSIAAITGFIKSVFSITSEFQKLGAVLTNTLGSRSAAQKALVDIKAFAAATPFSVVELTDAFVKLANQGFKPTTEELRKLGDLASSQGKSFMQLTEAIIDAQTGEFERLKEFGLRASKEGDKVTFTFKGVKTQTDFTADSIRKYILSLGDLQGVSGGMAAISTTLGGKLSNLGDNFDALLSTIGDSTGGLFGGILDLANKGLGKLNSALNDNGAKLREEQNELNILVSSITSVNTSQGARKLLIEQLNAKYPDFLKNMDLEKLSNEQLKTRMEDVNKQFVRKLALVAAEKEQINLIEDIIAAQTKQAEAEINIQKIQATGDANSQDRNKRLFAGIAIGAQQQVINAAKKEELELSKQAAGILEKYTKAAEVFNGTQNDYLVAAEKEVVIDNKKILTKAQLAEAARKAAAELKRINEAEYDYQVKLEKEEVRLKEESDAKKKAIRDNTIAEEKLAWEKHVEEVKAANDEMDVEAQKEFDRNLKREQDMAKAREVLIQRTATLIHTLIVAESVDRINALTAQQQQLELAKDKELKNAGDNAAKKYEIEQRYTKQQLDLQRRIAEEKHRLAVLEKSIAIANIIVHTAQAVVEALPVVPLAVLMGAIGATELAIVAATPIPQYAKGTDSAKGGKAIVGELGMELMKEPGKPWTLTPNSTTMIDVAKGTKIVPHDESMRMLAMSAIGSEAYLDRENRELQSELKELRRDINRSTDRTVDAILSNSVDYFEQGTFTYKKQKKNDGSVKIIRLKNHPE